MDNGWCLRAALLVFAVGSAVGAVWGLLTLPTLIDCAEDVGL